MNDLILDKSEFDSNSNKTITYLGFKNTDNNKEFLNTNSAIKYFDSFIFKSSASDKTKIHTRNNNVFTH